MKIKKFKHPNIRKNYKRRMKLCKRIVDILESTILKTYDDFLLKTMLNNKLNYYYSLQLKDYELAKEKL